LVLSGVQAGVPVMLRIVRLDPGAGASISTFKLEGKLVGPWVGELERACDELQVPPSGLSLDLSGMTFVDAAGVQLLAELMRRGAMIHGCNGFIAELLGIREH
jgi:ABC-type transporter Mla MlaB component